MKTFNIFLALLILTATACRKDQNTIHGQITYESFISGNVYYASGATVKLNDGAYSTTTNSSGEYSFSDVKDGSYTVKATGYYIPYNYEGSKSTSVGGKDDVTVSLTMY